MFANVFTKTTRDRQLGLLVGALSIAVLLWYGMAVYRTVYVSFYDQLPPAFLELMGIPAEGDVASLAFGAMYNLMGALTLAGLAISMGSASIAGEEANGTIGLLLGNPVSRRKVLLSKAASIVLLAAVRCRNPLGGGLCHSSNAQCRHCWNRCGGSRLGAPIEHGVLRLSGDGDRSLDREGLHSFRWSSCCDDGRLHRLWCFPAD